jgi:hypothetical protein
MRALVAAGLAAFAAAVLHASPAIPPEPCAASTPQANATPLVLWIFFDSAAFHGRGRTRVLDRVHHAGARVRYTSEWLHAVSVEADPEAVSRLERVEDVRAMQPVRAGRAAALAPGPALHAPRAAGSNGANRSGASDDRVTRPHVQGVDSTFYGPNWSALRALGIPNAHRLFFTGKGVRIGVLDTGFEPAHSSLATRTVLTARDFINGDDIVANQPGEPGVVDQERHGTAVWSLVGGFDPGNLVGPAHDATFLLAKVDQEPGDTRADEDRWVAGVEWAETHGARIILSSVVFRADYTDRPAIPFAALNGDVEVTSRIADEAARRGVLLVTAIGDDGPAPGSLSAPADADSVLAVGATTAPDQPAPFSSRGPTADARIKPELVARGTGLLAASSVSPASFDISLSGTSYSAPLIAGGAAQLMEAWPALSSMAVREALILSGSRIRTPDQALGYGVPDVAAAILFPRGIEPVRVGTIDLENRLTTIVPEFEWVVPLLHPSAAPVTYHVDVALDSFFVNIVHTDSVRDAFRLTSSRALRPGTLWWRVRADASAGVRRASGPRGPFEMPGWVRLLSPRPDRATFVNSLRPELAWSPLAAPPPIGPLTYDVEVLSAQTGLPVQPAIRNLTTSSVRVPQALTPNNSYRWRVIARTARGAVDTVESGNVFVVTSTDRPPVTLLQQNFPNPFPRPDLGMDRTTIWFDIAAAAVVDLAVFDLRGRFIRQLIPADNTCGPQTLPPGLYGRSGSLVEPNACVATTWDGTDHEGRTVAPGVYVLRLRVDGRDQFRRMVFLPR